MTDREMLECVADTINSTHDAILDHDFGRPEILGILSHLLGKVERHLRTEAQAKGENGCGYEGCGHCGG